MISQERFDRPHLSPPLIPEMTTPGLFRHLKGFSVHQAVFGGWDESYRGAGVLFNRNSCSVWMADRLFPKCMLNVN